MDERTLWRRADEILDRLLEIEADRRADALDAMGLAPEVADRVRRLLAAHARADGVLDRHPTRSTEPFAGRQFGPWIVEEEIGRGGMSVVFRACHADQPERRVALKLMTLGALVGAGIARFEREHSILARLSHPSIVPMLDAGVAADGTPWLAMGLVDGQRIDQWCRAQALDVRGRIRLVLEVCDALAYAHQNLVVHRDIKPSNVLVDAQGKVRLLDFGIARLADESSESTASAYRAMTPGYASPEQLRGDAAATTMDVYGTGALTHALLLGGPPPGDGAQTNAALPRDLSAVLECALAALPRRYPSIAALRADLAAWLEGRPVDARRGGASYVLARWVARHRVAVAAAVVVAASLAAGATTTLWQYRKALDAADRARAEAASATASRDFLVDLFRAADPERSGGAIDLRELFRRGAEKVRDARSLDDVARLQLLDAIAITQLSLTWQADAEATLALGLAIGQRGAARLAVPLARIHITRGGHFRRADRADEAQAEFVAADRLLAGTTGPVADSAKVSALTQWSLVEAQRGARDAALAKLAQAREIAGRTPGLPLQSRIILETSTGSVLYELGRYAEAKRALVDALALQRTDTNVGNASIALTLSWLGAVSAALNDVDDALDFDRQGLEVARASYPADHPEIAGALYAYGDSLRIAGRFEEALSNLEQAAAMQATNGDDGRPLALTQVARLRALLALGRFGAVVSEADRVRRAVEQHIGRDSVTAIQVVEQQVTAMLALGEPELGRLAPEALAQLARLPADQLAHPVAQSLRLRLAEVALARGDLPATVNALATLRQLQSGAPANPAIDARIQSLAVALALQEGDPDRARADSTALEAMLAEGTGLNADNLAWGWATIALACKSLADDDCRTRAVQQLERVRTIRPVPAWTERRVNLALRP